MADENFDCDAATLELGAVEEASAAATSIIHETEPTVNGGGAVLAMAQVAGAAVSTDDPSDRPIFDDGLLNLLVGENDPGRGSDDVVIPAMTSADSAGSTAERKIIEPTDAAPPGGGGGKDQTTDDLGRAPHGGEGAPASGSPLTSPLPTAHPLKRAPTRGLDFDLDDEGSAAGASSSAATVEPPSAILASTNSSTSPDIPLCTENTTVGRDDTCNAVLGDTRVSGNQFDVRRRLVVDGEVNQWVFELEDRSRNGTLVNKKVIRSESVRLKHNDLIEVLPAAKVGQESAIAFLYHGPADSSGVAVASASDVPLSPSKRRRTADQKDEIIGHIGCTTDTESIFAGATCVICQEVLHRAVSVQPCLHSFCSPCLGGWIGKPSRSNRACPVCRKDVIGVTRNHTLDSLIDGLFLAHPAAKRRPAEILAEMDARDPLKASDYDVSKLLPGIGAAGSSGGLFAGGRGGGVFGRGAGRGGLFAAAGPPGAFGGAADGDSSEDDASSAASSSDSSEPGMPPGRLPCFHCGTGAVMTIGASAARTFGGPAAAINTIIQDAFSRNEFESGVLTEWLTARGRGLGAAVADVLAVPNPDGAAPVRLRDGMVGAPLPERAWTDVTACRSCAQSTIRSVLYALRERIPEDELPAGARGRRSCWYGRQCRTAQHKPAHAMRLNHICEQTRF
eukprot:TRINITY_DN22809_c0_g1_i1.p1 TRINITY_DN22809_c0_g1~~TRINITY_DN22809_c0_g1_i1.p1  ORF type:complete len:677 (+),score=107.57 TRINITY_DN22809_c0_g1_i1:82-2112(+)